MIHFEEQESKLGSKILKLAPEKSENRNGGKQRTDGPVLTDQRALSQKDAGSNPWPPVK